MPTKTFRAPTMLAALQTVQKELGPDAIVLSMRQTDKKSGWQFWQKSSCEVIAMPRLPGARIPASPTRSAVETAQPGAIALPQPEAAPAPKAQAGAVFPPIIPPAVRHVPAAQTRQVYQLGSTADEQPEADQDETQLLKRDLPASLMRLEDHLKSQGVDSGLIQQIMTTCVRVITPLGMQDSISLENLAHRVMEAQVKINPKPNTFPPTRVMCLVGPSGSGKTSACAKLAYLYAKKLARKVVWIGADTIRTGAIAETRAYTEGLGIQLELAYLPEELEKAVTSFPDADLILVDTPRCNPFRENSLAEAAPFLSRIPGRSIYLVLPATMKDIDLRQAHANMRPFSPRGTIVTKLDETAALGSVYNLACQSPVPVTYLTASSQLSSGLHPASAEMIVNGVLNGRIEG